MKRLFELLIAPFYAAVFQEKTGSYYKNTRREAALSWIVPAISCFYISLLFHQYGHYPHFPATLFIVTVIAIPKFVVFFGLTWLLARLFSQTDRFYAFMAANNWFYIPYTIIYAAKVRLFTSDLVQQHPHFYRVITIFYLCLVVFFLAHNVLRLRQEIAWLVPIFFLIAYKLVWFVTGYHGTIFVF